MLPSGAGARTQADNDNNHDDQDDDYDDDEDDDAEERDLNSFMYQTVGHQVIPLYAEATGIPLYRRAITGRETQGKDYDGRQRHGRPTTGADADAAGRPREDAPEDEEDAEDETESMIPLLQAIKKAHPEANALCAGAVLSTYQRTRVESVALRLGLTPLAYLWKFPILPPPVPVSSSSSSLPHGDGAQLLDDMAAAGLEARIVKVASGGLDESFLWTNVASPAGKARVARAMRRFGEGEDVGAAVIGEGGEFETLVVDGPARLFKKRVVVEEKDMRVVREGGGSAWLRITKCRLEDKRESAGGGGEEKLRVRIPDVLDPKFALVLQTLREEESETVESASEEPWPLQPTFSSSFVPTHLQLWSFTSCQPTTTIQEETHSIISQIRSRLQHLSLSPSSILAATVLLRHMSDFPAINAVYGTLFDAPNPASRVTVSCGSALPDEMNIVVNLLVHTGGLPPSQRRGLHVQSRSYWAPANIGPYSQAVGFPVASCLAGKNRESESEAASGSGPRLVSIAGQIPLVPASMELPVRKAGGDEEDSLKFQVALALQHLWRIGIDTDVQWWTSAVAYFPASITTSGTQSDMEGMKKKARLAARAWRAAHAPRRRQDDDEEDEEEEDGPDIWDRKFNPQYMTYTSGGGDGTSARTGADTLLPDHRILSAVDTTSSSSSSNPLLIPPVFAVEVDSLPRNAGVEWHAHFGVANAAEKSVVVRQGRVRVPLLGIGGGDDEAVNEAAAETEVEAEVWQVVAPSGQTRRQQRGEDSDDEGEEAAIAAAAEKMSFIQTVVVQPFEVGQSLSLSSSSRFQGIKGVAAFTEAVLDRVVERVGGGEGVMRPAVLVRYVDASVLRDGVGKDGELGGPVVPCRSLWDGRGRRLAAVSVFYGVGG
jgi:diphthine-ammonia ligase